MKKEIKKQDLYKKGIKQAKPEIMFHKDAYQKGLAEKIAKAKVEGVHIIADVWGQR